MFCRFAPLNLSSHTQEFAKEAMAEQSLDHDEQINVRWAYDDPNPRAQAIRLRNNAQIMLAAMEAKGHIPQGAEMAYAEGVASVDEPDSKRPRTAAAPMTREEHAQQVAEAEAQLEAAAHAQAAAAAAADDEARRQHAVDEANRLDAILSNIDGGGGASHATDPLSDFLRSVDDAPEAQGIEPDAAATAFSVTNAVVARDAEATLPPGVRQPRGLPDGWREYSDPASGHPFYVSPTGESTWRRPA